MHRLILVEQETMFSRSERRPVINERYLGESSMTNEVLRAVKAASRKYRMAPIDVIMECLRFYFGDGKNHLECEHCVLLNDGECIDLAARLADGFEPLDPGWCQADQTTLPILD